MKVKIGPYKENGKRVLDIVVEPHDTIAMDFTLSLIILPLLKQLKKKCRFAPNVDNADLPKNLRSNRKLRKVFLNGDKRSLAQWKYILDEMIWAFSQVRNDWHEGAWSKKTKKEAMLYFDRVDNGLRLFGKYYLRLWE